MTNSIRYRLTVFSLGMLVFGALTFSHIANASPTKSKKKNTSQTARVSAEPREQFKAIEAGQTIGIDNEASTSFDENAGKPAAKKAETVAPAPVVTSSAFLPKDRGTFERVPSESKDSIAKRLKIIETLILDYGRAYDYRIHTTKELNAILDDLKKQTPPNNAAQSS